MNVLYTLTRNYYPFLKWSVHSLLEHNDDVENIFVFAEDDDVQLDAPCDIYNMSGRKWFASDSPNLNTPYSVMSLMRVYAPELLPIDKVLYLDVDTIICDSLAELWNTNLDGKWLAWCPEWRGNWKPYGNMYFNFGVALMNLAEMREDNVTRRLVHILNTEYCLYNEQDAMNKIMPRHKCVEMPVRYNECFCCGYTDNPAIVHYAGCRDWYKSETIYRWEYRKQYEVET